MSKELKFDFIEDVIAALGKCDFERYGWLAITKKDWNASSETLTIAGQSQSFACDSPVAMLADLHTLLERIA